MDIQGKKVLVIGMGKSGVAAAQLLKREGAEVTVSDVRSRKALGRKVYELEHAQIVVETGRQRQESSRESDLVVISPGVPVTHPAVEGALLKGIPVIGEMELGYSFLSAPVIGITGSNGKSTTTTLIGDILEAAGLKVFVGGNLGTPLCQFVLSRDRVDWVVVEVSSFQLETIRTFRPRVAVLLNITPDHLDRYPSLSEYAEAKMRIFEYQTGEDFAVLHAEDPWTPMVLEKYQAVPKFFSRESRPQGGVSIREGWIVASLSGRDQKICEVSKIGIQGVHNLENAMASVATALLCGCDGDRIGETLQKFAGLEHRLEFVRDLQGVRYINDSKGTNVGAVARSLESFQNPVILIAGGKDKGGDFATLRDVVRTHVKQLVLIGEARPKMKSQLGDVTDVLEARSLKEAVTMAYHHSRRGDVVLLSPACASFDMFKNFEERGDQYKKLVWGLPTMAYEKLNGNVSAR